MQHGDSRTVKEVVRRLGEGEHAVEVVLCSDGKLGVLQDGQLVANVHWTVDQLPQCLEFAERLAKTQIHSIDFPSVRGDASPG